MSHALRSADYASSLDGECGRLVPPEDPTALAQALGDDLSNRVIWAPEPLTPDVLLALCDRLRADYLVIFAPFPQRDSRGREERFTTGLTMLVRNPGRFSLAFVSRDTYVLKVEPVASTAMAGPRSAVERAERR